MYPGCDAFFAQQKSSETHLTRWFQMVPKMTPGSISEPEIHFPKPMIWGKSIRQISGVGRFYYIQKSCLFAAVSDFPIHFCLDLHPFLTWHHFSTIERWKFSAKTIAIQNQLRRVSAWSCVFQHVPLQKITHNCPSWGEKKTRWIEAQLIQLKWCVFTSKNWRDTPPKINMEHNNGGLEGDFPFHIGDF